jgi:hypothetical protein
MYGNLMWLCIGGSAYGFVVAFHKMFTAKSREAKRLADQKSAVKEALECNAEQHERLVGVLREITIRDPDLPGDGVNWEKLTIRGINDDFSMRGECHGVLIRYLVKLGTAYIEWNDGSELLSVHFDLKKTVPAEKLAELTVMLEYKHRRSKHRRDQEYEETPILKG